jgi:starch phosphorylase
VYGTTRGNEVEGVLHGIRSQDLSGLRSGFFSEGDPSLFKPLVDEMLHQDEYMLLADYQPYVECRVRVSEAYRDQEYWTRMSILNVARMGKFSSDRSIREYSEKIWKVEPLPVKMEEH